MCRSVRTPLHLALALDTYKALFQAKFHRICCMFPRVSCFACSRWRMLHDRWSVPRLSRSIGLPCDSPTGKTERKILFWTRWIGEISWISRSGNLVREEVNELKFGDVFLKGVLGTHVGQMKRGRRTLPVRVTLMALGLDTRL